MLEYLEIAGVILSLIGMAAVSLYAVWALLYLVVFGWPVVSRKWTTGPTQIMV